MKIHHWIIPTKKNKFHPHALRPAGLAIFLAIFLSLPFMYNMVSAGQPQVLGYATNISSGDLLALTNQERVAQGLGPLSSNGLLNSAAIAKANHMFANNYWAHVAPDGTTPWSFINGVGYNYSAAGENLAKDFNTSSGTVAGWMASATHRANILSSSYQDVGFAVVDGTLLGSQTTLVVAMYGTQVAPAPTPTPTAPSVTPAQTVPIQSSPSTQPTVTDIETPEVPVITATPETTTPVEESVAQQDTSTLPSSDLGVEASGNVEGIATFLPVRVYSGLNWGQKVSLALLGVLVLLFIMKHTIVWRQQKRGVRHVWLRAHPISQMVLLIAVFVVTALAGTGTIL